MIAFLCQTLAMGHREVPSVCRIVSWRGIDRGECEYMGEEMPFRLVTTDEQLRGLEIRQFRVVGFVPQSMVQVARSRVR